jgi:hypothetical protein
VVGQAVPPAAILQQAELPGAVSFALHEENALAERGKLGR